MRRGAGWKSLAVALLTASAPLAACGTALLETGRPTTDDDVAAIRRGGARLGCREQRSELFRVYLICDAEGTPVGLMDVEGQLAFACPDVRKRRCKKLFERMLREGSGADAASPDAGIATVDAGVPPADAGVASPDAEPGSR